MIYYYKTFGDVWHFEDGITLSGGRAYDYFRSLREKGVQTWRLFLDIPEDFELIKKFFHTPAYWKHTTWLEELQKY